jgi:hypothetical protein
MIINHYRPGLVKTQEREKLGDYIYPKRDDRDPTFGKLLPYFLI